LLQEIDAHHLVGIAEHHQRVFKSGKKATYLPALLKNVSTLVAEDQRYQAVLSAMDWASSMIEAAPAGKTTSFRLMDCEAIKKLLESKFSCELFRMTSNGEISFQEGLAIQSSAEEHRRLKR